MPLAAYDRWFGGKPGGAAKALASMVDQYGPERGQSIFYATVNRKKKGKRPGGALSKQLRKPY